MPSSHFIYAVAVAATFRRFRTFPSWSVIVFLSPVSAPIPRTGVLVLLRDCDCDPMMISIEPILDTDGSLRPRALGDKGGDVAALEADNVCGLASERCCSGG